MRRVILTVAGTISALVLLLGFKPHTTASALRVPVSVVQAPAPAPTTAVPAPATAAPAPTNVPAPTTAAPAVAASGTFTGDVVDTRWGPVQVSATLTDGKLTDVAILELPSGNSRDQQINDYAVPILVRASIAADGADIDMVSGATVTSEGYLSSLQSALDQARG